MGTRDERLIAELQTAIAASLDDYLVDNAVLLAEQLYHTFACDDHAVLLAECYLRQNQV
jgi:hypothetical protein